MTKTSVLRRVFPVIVLWFVAVVLAADMPLPEHPRPDWQRPLWMNLNGPWAFRFDPQNRGEQERWQRDGSGFPDTITVPFSWGAPLSGLKDEADIGWYSKTLDIPDSWSGKRVFLVIGACDWQTTAWLDGQLLGKHRGGYAPFEFELTKYAKPGGKYALVLRVDDTPHPFKLEGKQGYGKARGIWQTPYLEARGATFLSKVHFTPDIDQGTVEVQADLSDPAPPGSRLTLQFTGGLPERQVEIPKDSTEFSFSVDVPKPHLWQLDDPFLYNVALALDVKGKPQDEVKSYFGMRKVSVVKTPAGYSYIALINRPVYLQLTLDQAYNPEGYYTFPSDAFMRDEILRSRRIGLNGMRIHVKVGIPRKLYWADRLGMLIMADVPNSWGEPDAEMRKESETALRGMIERDYNHPAIFSWVLFNETWGLKTKKEYLPETQKWVVSMYNLAKSLDSSRLVEDNSACNYDHTVTDINSWHVYIPGFAWREHLDEVTSKTFPGSTWNFIGGRKQGEQPLLNSECGNVWGYQGSTGDVDWSWDYHQMINEFRRHPKVCGWLYTEHHDVVNEWNGYYRYDRGEKFTGLSELVPGMSLRDLHSPYYIVPEGELCRQAEPGAKVRVPLWLSVLTDQVPADGKLRLHAELAGWDDLGRDHQLGDWDRTLPAEPWYSGEIAPLEVTLPDFPGLMILRLTLQDLTGRTLHRNFTTFSVSRGQAPREETRENVRLVRFAPDSFADAHWSLKQWNVLDGLKVDGAGSGYFEYRIPWPAGLDVEKVAEAGLTLELSAKQLFGKDREGATQIQGDYMRGKGTFDPSRNPNSYPMTDTVKFPSAVRIACNGVASGVYDLPDDPADHRGILSWYSQKRDRHLREAGSYGYPVRATIPPQALQKARAEGTIVIRLEVDDSLPGGLAIYGARFGRYPLDPTLVFVLGQ